MQSLSHLFSSLCSLGRAHDKEHPSLPLTHSPQLRGEITQNSSLAGAFQKHLEPQDLGPQPCVVWRRLVLGLSTSSAPQGHKEVGAIIHKGL